MGEDIKDIQNITVLGAGMMGPGLAQIFAVKGYSVTICDRRPEALPEAMERIRANLTLMVQKGIGHQEDIEPAIERIKTTSDFDEAVSSAHFVEEAIDEDLALKQDVFQRLGSLCSQEAILATNTSVISPTEIAQKAKHQERILGTHFWNSPHLIPLVEVVKAKETSAGKCAPGPPSREMALTRLADHGFRVQRFRVLGLVKVNERKVTLPPAHRGLRPGGNGEL